MIRSSHRDQTIWRRMAPIVAIVGLLIAGILILTAPEPDTKPSGPRDSLHLGLAIHPSSALIMIALHRDLFAEESLDVSMTAYPSGKRALLDGLYPEHVDIATSGDVPLAMAAFAHRPVKIIATTFGANNVNRIIARRSSGITQPRDLIGKRVATQRASAVHFFLHLFLLEYGISDTDISPSYLKAEELPEALANGSIDAFAMREPYISMARERLGDDAVVFDHPGVYHQFDGLVVSNEILRNNPRAVKKFLRALLKAERITAKDHTAAIKATAHFLDVSEAQTAAVLSASQLRIALDQEYLLLLENEARWAIRSAIVNTQSVPNYLNMIHLDLLLELKPEAVSIIR